jgi:hypothetical protein
LVARWAWCGGCDEKYRLFLAKQEGVGLVGAGVRGALLGLLVGVIQFVLFSVTGLGWRWGGGVLSALAGPVSFAALIVLAEIMPWSQRLFFTNALSTADERVIVAVLSASSLPHEAPFSELDPKPHGKIVIRCPNCNHLHKLAATCPTCAQEREWKVSGDMLHCASCHRGIKTFACKECKHDIPMIADFAAYYPDYIEYKGWLPDIIELGKKTQRYNDNLNTLEPAWVKHDLPADYPLDQVISRVKGQRTLWILSAAVTGAVIGGLLGAALLPSSFGIRGGGLEALVGLAGGALLAGAFARYIGGRWGLANGKFIDSGAIVLISAAGAFALPVALVAVIGAIVLGIAWSMLRRIRRKSPHHGIKLKECGSRRPNGAPDSQRLAGAGRYRSWRGCRAGVAGAARVVPRGAAGAEQRGGARRGSRWRCGGRVTFPIDDGRGLTDEECAAAGWGRVAHGVRARAGNDGGGSR